MIKNSRQNWEIGSKIKVGFLEFEVFDFVRTPGDYEADAYILLNARGEFYTFVPHGGLRRGIAIDSSYLSLAQRLLYL